MYSLINDHAGQVVESLAADDFWFVKAYEWLLQNTISQQIGTAEYQQKYSRYWALNVGQLSPEFPATYFGALTNAIQQAPELERIIDQLYEASARRNGQKSVQFSFATKLLHMVDPHLPIYDSLVAEFYFFQAPIHTDYKKRISEIIAFYEFLIAEYARILRDGLLSTAIQEFRGRLHPTCCTDEKIIDSLIWSFVKLLHRKVIVYR